MDRRMLFGELPMGRLILKMSVPFMLSMLVQALYNAVDSLYVAQLGLQALTALGLANPIQIIMIAISNGIGVGMNATVSQRMGRKDLAGASNAIGNAMFAAFVAMLCMIVFGIFGSRPYLMLCSNDPVVIQAGVEYLSLCTIISVGQFFGIIGHRLLIVSGRSIMGMIVQMLGAVINIVLDPVFIFGVGPIPAMGIRGAAVATVLAQIVTLVVAFAVFSRRKGELCFTIKDCKPDKQLLELLRPGIPAALTMVLISIMSFGMNQVLKNEALNLAIFIIYYRLWNFAAMPVHGLMQGIIPVIGFNFGAKLKARLKEAIKLCLIIAVGIMVVVLLIFQIFTPQLIALFDDGNNVAEFYTAGVYAIRVISWIFVPFAIAQVLSTVFQGMGNGMPSLIYSLLHQCVILIPVAYLLLTFGGSNLVWFAFWIAQAVSMVVALLLYRNARRRLIDPLPDSPITA